MMVLMKRKSTFEQVKAIICLKLLVSPLWDWVRGSIPLGSSFEVQWAL